MLRNDTDFIWLLLEKGQRLFSHPFLEQDTFRSSPMTNFLRGFFASSGFVVSLFAHCVENCLIRTRKFTWHSRIQHKGTLDCTWSDAFGFRFGVVRRILGSCVVILTVLQNWRNNTESIRPSPANRFRSLEIIFQCNSTLPLQSWIQTYNFYFFKKWV